MATGLQCYTVNTVVAPAFPALVVEKCVTTGTGAYTFWNIDTTLITNGTVYQDPSNQDDMDLLAAILAAAATDVFVDCGILTGAQIEFATC